MVRIDLFKHLTDFGKGMTHVMRTTRTNNAARRNRRRSWRATTALLLLITSLTSLPANAQQTPTANPPALAPGASMTPQGLKVRVYAYREGLVGQTTANGHVIQPNDRFVALPCFCVLSSKGGSEFQVKIDYKGKNAVAPVWDVGPWNVGDNYWDPPAERAWQGLPQGMPQAQAANLDGYNGGKDGWGRTITSPGGIDIGDGTFADLGMTGSDWVEVTFLWTKPARYALPSLPSGFNDIPTVWPDERPPLDPAQPIGDGRYGFIWETMHNVPNALIDYWWANGNWRTFGLPISEFFRQPQPDGSIRYVQYFERAVLSIDLSGSTDPPLITGDLLGYTTRIDPAAAQPVKPFESDSVCTYYAETGHALCNGFRNYWNANGGLPVFGYPLSEEWGTTVNGEPVVMQVFERARLEWWPNKVGTDAEFTLGLLTVEMLRQQGWVE